MMTGGPWSPPATFGKDFARETHRPDPRASPRLVLRLGRRRSVRLARRLDRVGADADPTPSPTPSPSATATGGPLALSGNISAVHDPAILKDGNTYYLFTTGNAGMSRGCSAYAPRPISRTGRCTAAAILPCPLGQRPPCRARRACGPDISKVNGQYRLYYSISTFGKNQSAIGLATATKIDPNAPAANWVDQGPVIQSQTSDNFNAIDPMAFVDASGNDWMVFGSYWSGIKLIRLDPATGLRLAGDAAPRSLAERPAPDAIEGPYIIRHGDFYYLFASFDACCQGPRAPITRWSAAPPRRTALCRPRRQGDAEGRWNGRADQRPGRRQPLRGTRGVAVLQQTGGDYIVYHAYDTQRNGIPTLQIQRLGWTTDGWPVAQ